MQPRGKEPPDFPTADRADEDKLERDGLGGENQHEQEGPEVNVTMQRTGVPVSTSGLKLRIGRLFEVEGRAQGPSRHTALIVGLICELGAGGLWISNSAAGITVSVLVAALLISYFVIER